MHFDLKKPCKSCPFRTNSLKGWLGKSRAKEIADALYKKDQTFSCHKTVDYNSSDWDDESGERIYFNREGEQHCVGALIMMEKKGYANQMGRIAERLGIYNRNNLVMTSPVFDNQNQFINHHTQTKKTR
jgi:hypothetical protein